MDTWPLDDVMRVVASAAVSRITHRGYIAQWSERLTADQQVPGSNPGVPFGCCGVVTHTLQLWKGRATGPVTVAQQLLWCIHPARIELATFSVLG